MFTIYTLQSPAKSYIKALKKLVYQLIQTGDDIKIWMRQKGIILNHDFYVVVGKQCRTENVQRHNFITNLKQMNKKRA